MPLLDSGTNLLTGGEDVIVDEVGPIIFAARFDFSELVATDTVVIRYTVDLDQGGTTTTRYWELVHSTTTLPDGGTFGVDTDGFETPVLWAEANATITVEQTVGTPVNVTWETHRLVEMT